MSEISLPRLLLVLRLVLFLLFLLPSVMLDMLEISETNDPPIQ